jgi:hypothetical protein
VIVYISKPNSARPKYHFGSFIDCEGITARCGAWLQDRSYYTAQLRRERADLIAKPCRRCFPKATP